MITFSEHNQIILSEDEQKSIVELFPKEIQSFLQNINNPLDETQILLHLFKERGTRIVTGLQKDEFGDIDYASYFHVVDIAKEAGYDEQHARNWAKSWKINFVSLENLPANFERVPIKINFEGKTTNNKANFINEQYLKLVLLKLRTKEAKIFQEWILKQSTISKKILKYVVQIKHQQELNQKDIEVNKYKKELEAIKISDEERTQLTLNSVKLFPDPKRESGTIYIATSPDFQKKYSYKIGLTTGDAKTRESQLQTSNPPIELIFHYPTSDVNLAERVIHSYLKHLKYDKEFFYISSLEKAKEIVIFVTNFVNECIDKFDNDSEVIQKQYIADMSNHNKSDIKLELIRPQQIQNRGRSKSPSKRLQIVNTPPLLQITENNIYKQYLDERTEHCNQHIHTSTLYDDFKSWFVVNNPRSHNIPSNRDFAKEIKKYHTIENVRVKSKLTTGIKNLQLINSVYE